MAKWSKILFLFCSIFTILVGCSSGDSKKIDVNSNTVSYLEDYDTQIMNFIQGSNLLLVDFNRDVDSLYTKEISNAQFGQLVKKTIPESQSLIEALETAEVHTNLLGIHQELISLGNLQHQLFLNAMEMANNNEVDKQAIRNNYLEVKSAQSTFLNQWKEMTIELEQAPSEEG